MRIRAYISISLAFVLFMAAIAPEAGADSAPTKEYQIKAAFLYNFIKFVGWPKEKMPENKDPIILAILGKDPFANAFDPVKDKPVKGKRLLIKRFKGLRELRESAPNDKTQLNQQIAAIRKCHLLFICRSEKERLTEIMEFIPDHNILTVADTPGFLNAAGIINFVVDEKKVGFEINITAAKRASLEIRSQLQRLAKRVVGGKQEDKAKG